VIAGEIGTRLGTILIVRDDICYDGNTSGGVAFIDELFQCAGIRAFTVPTLVCAVDVVVRHALGSRGKNCVAQAKIGIRITAAQPGCDSDFSCEFRKELASFLVEGTFEVFDFRPRAMTRHVDQGTQVRWVIKEQIRVRTALALQGKVEIVRERRKNRGRELTVGKIPNLCFSVNSLF
jgi:hypothetical protein